MPAHVPFYIPERMKACEDVLPCRTKVLQAQVIKNVHTHEYAIYAGREPIKTIWLVSRHMAGNVSTSWTTAI